MNPKMFIFTNKVDMLLLSSKELIQLLIHSLHFLPMPFIRVSTSPHNFVIIFTVIPIKLRKIFNKFLASINIFVEKVSIAFSIWKHPYLRKNTSVKSVENRLLAESMMWTLRCVALESLPASQKVSPFFCANPDISFLSLDVLVVEKNLARKSLLYSSQVVINP